MIESGENHVGIDQKAAQRGFVPARCDTVERRADLTMPRLVGQRADRVAGQAVAQRATDKDVPSALGVSGFAREGFHHFTVFGHDHRVGRDDIGLKTGCGPKATPAASSIWRFTSISSLWAESVACGIP